MVAGQSALRNLFHAGGVCDQTERVLEGAVALAKKRGPKRRTLMEEKEVDTLDC